MNVVRKERRVFWIMLLLLIFLSMKIAAQDYSCDPTLEICDYGALLPDDYQNPVVYSDPAFYEESDPQYWEWDVVDWKMVDFSRAELYETKEFYQNIPENFYLDLDYAQVDYTEEALDYGELDYTQIDYEQADQLRIESDKYFADLGCVQCQLREKGSLITFSNNGISHAVGDFVSIPGEYPKGSLFIANTKEIHVDLPSETTELKLSEKDKVGVHIMDDTQKVTINGLKVNGYVMMKNGEMFVLPGDITTIESVTIISYEIPVQVYNDGKPHEGSFVSMSDSMGTLAFAAAEKEEFRLTLSEEWLQKESFSVSKEKEDFLSFLISDGAAGELLRRPGSTSLLELTPGDGYLDLANGPSAYIIKEERMYLEGYNERDKRGSVPLTVIVLDQEGNIAMNHHQKYIFDNHGNMQIVGEPSDIVEEHEQFSGKSALVEYEKKKYECELCAVNFAETSFLYTQSKKKIMDATNIETITTSNSAALMKAALLLEQLPEADRNAIRAIQIVPDETIEQYCGKGTAGCAYSGKGEIIIPESNVGNYEIWLHEAAHIRTGELDTPSAAEKRSKEEELKVYHGQLTESSDDNGGVPEGKSFKEKWLTATGGDTLLNNYYGYDRGELVVAERNAVTWSDGVEEARYGCVSAYACNNYWEDVAETAEVAAAKPEYYADLIDSKSSYYEEKMWKPVSGWKAPQIMIPSIAKDWAEIYREKLELSHEYGFITDAHYRQIVPEG